MSISRLYEVVLVMEHVPIPIQKVVTRDILGSTYEITGGRSYHQWFVRSSILVMGIGVPVVEIRWGNIELQ